MIDLHDTAKRVVLEAMAGKTPNQLTFLRALHDEYFPPRDDGGQRYQLEDIVYQLTKWLLSLTFATIGKLRLYTFPRQHRPRKRASGWYHGGWRPAHASPTRRPACPL